MRNFLGSFHNFLLLLPPLLSNSLPADPGTARLLTLESDIAEVQEKWKQYRNIVTITISAIFIVIMLGASTGSACQLVIAGTTQSFISNKDESAPIKHKTDAKLLW